MKRIACLLALIPTVVLAAPKFSDSLARSEIPGYTVVNPGVAAFNVVFHPPLEDAERLALRYGADVVGRAPSINVLVLEMPILLVGLFSLEDSVRWIESPIPRLRPMNDGSRLAADVDDVQAAPYNLDGTGVVVMIYDDGVPYDEHPTFSVPTRVTHHDIGPPIPENNHPTGVAGTCCGDGTGSTDEKWRGMATNVAIEAYSFENSPGGILFYSNISDIDIDYEDAIVTQSAVVANNSLGSAIELFGYDCDIQGNYGVTSALLDSIIRGAYGDKIAMVWATGNERNGSDCDIEGHGDYYSMAPPACAKNIISVGGVNKDDNSMTVFSSWGPCDDGRIKPDLVASGSHSSPGVGVDTAFSTSGYAGTEGTSIAAPVVTGVIALLLQDYRDQWPNRPNEMEPSMYKATLIHSALDLFNTGPDYKSGYGHVQAQAAIDNMRTGAFWEADISDGETCRRDYKVTTSLTEIKITIAWEDPEALFNPTVALINDIDLELVDPLGTVYYPFTLDPDDPGAVAITTVADHLNNVEQVIVESPMVGTWTIKIIGNDVVASPQKVSVVGASLVGDLNNDGFIDGTDYLILLANWGTCPGSCGVPSCLGDLDNDCRVGIKDQLIMFANWGPC